MFTNTFAIKIGKTTGDKLLAKLLKDLTNSYPNFTVENLTHNMRPSTTVESVTTAIIGNKLVRQVDVKQKKLEYLTIGYSSTFDVSFESKSALYVGPIPMVKIYDINKDFIKVVEALATYLGDKYKASSLIAILNDFREKHCVVATAPTTINVVKHSCFAEVNGVPVAYKYKKRRNNIGDVINLLLSR